MSATSVSSDTTPRADPTRTTTTRNRLGGRLSQRTRDARGAVRQQVEGHQQPPSTATLAGVAVAGVGGLTALRSITAFRRWLGRVLDTAVLDTTPDGQVRRGGHWTAPFVRAAYETGLRQARAALRAHGYDVDDRPTVAVLADARHQKALTHQYERAYVDLDDAAENMTQAVSRAVADGGYIDTDVRSISRRAVADRINERLRAEYGKRLSPLGDSIAVRAANRAALTEYGHYNVEQVGIEPEADPDGHAMFRTARDDRVCQQCMDIAADNPYRLSEVPIPVIDTHLRCRCMVLPAA